jgi:N-acetylglucosamine-6-phosphate deacetylase
VSFLLAGRIARGGRLEAGWIEIEGDTVRAVGVGDSPGAPDARPDGILVPGLCELQVNGAGGCEVCGGIADLDRIDAVQLSHGVTSYLPTLISPDDGTAKRVLAELQRRAADPASPVIGAHLEGPFLSPEHAGIHSRERLRLPGDGIPEWLTGPPVRMVTLAPELPGALKLIRDLTERGIVVSLGHSGADAGTVRAAIEAGATMATHVFNAMGPLDHRAPGLAGVALVDERVRVGVIADGIHVDSLVLELVRRAAKARVVLVSDATPAAAAPPGRYEMAGVAIETDAAGAARTPDGTLAGSTLTLDDAVRLWTEMTGATFAEAIAAASESPAAAVGLPAPLAPGSPADLAVFDEGGAVVRVMRRGRWLAGGEG